MSLSRRQFLGVAAGGAAVGLGAWAALVRDQAEQAPPDETAAPAPTAAPGRPFSFPPAELVRGAMRVKVSSAFLQPGTTLRRRP